jgi:hypothetical protein
LRQIKKLNVDWSKKFSGQIWLTHPIFKFNSTDEN